MDIFELPALEICPWALREGVILERLDQITGRALTVAAHRPLDGLGLPRVLRARVLATPPTLGYDAVEVMVGIDALSQQTAGDPAALRPPRDPGVRRARAVPAVHPAGLGHRAVGQARAVRRDGARASAPRWSSYTRRSAGRRRTPRTSSTASRRWRRRPASPSRSRTCTRGGRRAGAAWRCTCPAGTRRRSPTPTPRSTSRTPRSRTPT